MSADTTNSNDRHSNGRFANGNPGGPGRPRSAVALNAERLDALGSEAGEELMKVLLELAKSGNLKALDMVLSRVWPARRGRPIELDAPLPETGLEVLDAKSAILQAALDGELSLSEAADAQALLESHREAIREDDHMYEFAKAHPNYGRRR